MHSFRTLVKFNHIGKNRITSGPNLEIFHQESSFRMGLQKSVWSHSPQPLSFLENSGQPSLDRLHCKRWEGWEANGQKRLVFSMHKKRNKRDSSILGVLKTGLPFELGTLQPYAVYRFSGDFILVIICMGGFYAETNLCVIKRDYFWYLWFFCKVPQNSCTWEVWFSLRILLSHNNNAKGAEMVLARQTDPLFLAPTWRNSHNCGRDSQSKA